MILQARIQEQTMESQVLSSKLALESQHVKEMEDLVARMRAAEHQVELVSEGLPGPLSEGIRPSCL